MLKNTPSLRLAAALLAATILVTCAAAQVADAPNPKENKMTTETKPMIRSSHFRLLVTDYDAEYKFLRDVLGFRPTFGSLGENYADFECNGAFCLAIFKRSIMSADVKTDAKPTQADSQDRVALIFGVADVDATTAELRKKGVVFVSEPHDRKDWGIRVAHFRDPDGNLIEINHGLPPN
jgi:lactoylglutathione lyase